MGRLTEDMTNLRGGIDALRNGRGEFIAGLKQNVFELKAGFNTDHAKMARKLRDDLDTFVSELEANVTEMKAGFNKDHAEMAGKLRDDLETFVSELEANVTEMKAGFNKDHAEMAGKLRDDLETFVSSLKNTVAGKRQEFAEDIVGARRAWSGPSPAERMAVEKRKRDEARLLPDDLTEITGIGAGREKLLNEAGIYTFAQLGGINPEALRKALGESARSADVKKWIEEAKALI